jgi:hypothetical protein
MGAAFDLPRHADESQHPFGTTLGVRAPPSGLAPDASAEWILTFVRMTEVGMTKVRMTQCGDHGAASHHSSPSGRARDLM